MIASLGLLQLVPRTILDRWIVVLVCYLDDSGKDSQNPITTIAGYVGSQDQWARFETEVEPVFQKYGVAVLHAKELHHSEGCFKGWSVLKKQSFVAQLATVLSKHAALGVSMSALKSTYKMRAAESNRKRTVTPYSFCSNVLLDWILRGVITGKEANSEGISFVFEEGHENNAEAEMNFAAVSKIHKLENVLRPVTFVPKKHCHAIQLADLFAFYSRRHGVEMVRAKPEDRVKIQRSPGQMLNIMTERLQHRAYVATDFGPNIDASRFFAGDLEESS